jgi:hypothetical protein
MGKPKAPPPPDYATAARITSEGNKEAALAAQAGNMINQYTPQGSVEYAVRGTQDGTPLWSQTVNMSPTEKAAYEQNAAINTRLGGVAGTGIGYVESALAKPLSTAGMMPIGTPGEIQRQASDAAYSEATRYMAPEQARATKNLETQLSNQGITRGSEAWNQATGDMSNQQTQALASARNQAYMQGLQGAGQAYTQGMGGRQQQIAEEQMLQQNPINMLNAVRSGQQMQVANQPQVGVSSAGQLGQWSGPDMLGAASAQGQYDMGVYNAKSAANSALTSGLFSLGGAAIKSDIRTKENIIEVGALHNGLKLYSFEYKPEFKDSPNAGHGRFVGCMAHEVEEIFPDAVNTTDDGYKAVDYGRVYG